MQAVRMDKKYNMTKILGVLHYWNFVVIGTGDNKICLERQ